MEQTVTDVLDFEAEWEQSTACDPAERVCFAALEIRCGDICLTEAEDRLVKRTRTAVYVSAYPMAEWLAWNWWRLRWEPQRAGTNWALAHRMTTIGHGYIWPNITIQSDGEQIFLLARPTKPTPAEPIRYIGDRTISIRAKDFESAIDRFIEQVLSQLAAERVESTALKAIWADVKAEQHDPEMSLRRRFEALLGYDPDEADEGVIDTLVRDAQALGKAAMTEIAADHRTGAPVPTAQDLRGIADTAGAPADMDKGATLDARGLPPFGRAQAWERGEAAARALRAQEKLGAGPISDKQLADMAGIAPTVLTRDGYPPAFSFALVDGARQQRIVLRSKWVTGRRFELARLLGDHLAGGGSEDRLLPATKAYTYRQRLQRAFAAELLCPLAALNDVLDGDYSMEAIEDAANHFQVSPMMARTLLVNHDYINRDSADDSMYSSEKSHDPTQN